jgi:predicted RNA-binding protein YlxR (DUF448 family)
MPKHIPLRTCVVTREKLPKKELIRFVLESSSGKVKLDLTGKEIKGRGANMTPSLETFEEAIKRKVLNRALKTEIKGEDIKRLREELEKYIETKEIEMRGKITVRVTQKELEKVQNGKK